MNLKIWLFLPVMLANTMVGQNKDSLLKILPVLKGADRIYCLISLAETERATDCDKAKWYNYESIKLAKKTDDNKLIAEAYACFGSTLSVLKQIDSSKYYFIEALNLWPDDYKIDGKVQLIMDLVSVFQDLEEYDTSIVVLKNFFATEPLLSPQKHVILLHLLSQGYYHLARYEQSVDQLLKATEIQRSINDTAGLVDFYNKISTIKRKLGNFQEAIEFNSMALRLNEKTGNIKGEAESYSALGGIYYYMSDNENAIKYFRLALGLFEKLGDISRIAALNNNIGSVFNETGELQQALNYYKRSLEYYKTLKSEYAQAILSDNIGLAYSGLNQSGKALIYFQEALKLQEKNGNKDGYAHCLVNVAGLYKNMGEFNLSLETYNKALALAVELNLGNEELQIYQGLSELYEKMEKYKEALNYYKLYQQTNDTLLSIESREQLNELQTKLDLKERENKIILLSKENELANTQVQKQRLVMVGVIIISVMAFVLLFIVYRALQFSRVAKARLQEQNRQITEQRNEIQIKNKQLTDSINYASRVQDALNVPLEGLSNYVADYFLISKPQNIVSGDFYWFRYTNNHLFVCLADCTGHGVPGAFMSMLGRTLLNEVIGSPSLLSTNEILEQLRLKVKSSLHQSTMQGNTDGMDMALCRINTLTLEVEYSGAFQSVFIIENNKAIELKADKMPVALSRKEAPFTVHKFTLDKGSTIYFSSDGFYDQFGGKQNDKITKPLFKELLEKIIDKPMSQQKWELESFFDAWKNKMEQTDDVMVLGIQF
jgi:tetratricopeptide (TPR) repeat protein